MAVDKKECRYIERCEFDGIWLRPWDQVMAYKEPRSENCGGIKTTLECGKDAAKFSMYPYSYCMPYNSGTSLDIINTYHP
jgi:hypothetical protein